jgi:hypothetical protein
MLMRLMAALAAAGLLAFGGCEGADSAASSDADSDADSDSDSDNDTDSDSDSDSDTEYNGPATDLQGTVFAPSGEFPISGALVYITDGDGSTIPGEVFCYECEDMTGKKWTLSNPDGSWTIEDVPAGTRNIVTRKGFFQRQREIVITGNETQDVPAEFTTLPPDNSGDGMDQIPNYAVLLNGWDLPEDMLAKMGLGELDSSGHLVDGTEHFDLYNDLSSGPSALGDSSLIFDDQSSLNHYHMVFFPCVCSHLNASGYIPMLQTYVEEGGKIYGSCWAGQWPEQPFPDILDFTGSDTGTSPGNVGSYTTHGMINDEEMRAWLEVVQPMEDLDYYTFDDGWIMLEGVASGYPGHGLEEDGWLVVPKVWVTDQQAYNGHPMTVTFNYDCGKVFYSTYQVVESNPSPQIRAQEFVLIYLFFEVGVCEGEYIPPE